MIKREVSDNNAELLYRLPMLLVTATDGAGALWATALFGQPGFAAVDADDPSLVRITRARLLDSGAVGC